MPWTPKYPMGLTLVPKPMARTAFVMLSFQCLIASSLGQSMPHSCSSKDPMCFPFFSSFSISGYMPATKIKSLHSTAGSENIWQLCCQKLFHTIRRSQFQRQMWDQAQNHFKETKPVNTLRPGDSFCFLLVSSHFVCPNFKRPIPSQKWILKQQAQHENQLPMYEPLPSPRQSHAQNDPGNPSRATAVVGGRVHRGPRRDQLLDHGGVAVQSRKMQRRPASGAEDARRTAGRLRLPWRNKA